MGHLGNSPARVRSTRHYILQPTMFGRWQGAPLMGKHGVLVWDRIFEGGEAKSAAELARIGNGTYYVGQHCIILY